MPYPEEQDKLATRDSTLVPIHAQKQRRRMLFALGLLLFALLLVFIRDRQFWFPSSSPPEAANPAPGISAPEPQTAVEAQRQTVPQKRTRPRIAAPPTTVVQESQPQAVISNRAVLPPLQVEVVAGGQHRALQPGNTSINVEMEPPSAAPSDSAATSSSPAPAAPSQASERVRLSPDTDQVVANPVRPSYPTLARQMKVQGSVVLQALIGKTGTIQDLQVLSGPSILSSAAQEAVKQWRFKPYYQNGQPVETQCSITVNFTISTQ